MFSITGQVTAYFRDDHGRPLRVVVEASGYVSLHFVLPNGDVIPLPEMRDKPWQSGSVRHADFAEYIARARSCPLCLSTATAQSTD